MNDPHNSNIDKNDQKIKKTQKIITLSYNTNVVKSKNDGGIIEQFMPISFDIEKLSDRKELENFFKNHVYSVNRFIGRGPKGQKLTGKYQGYSTNKNFNGMYAIGIDYDDGSMSIEEARSAWKHVVHIIHTSSSHMLDVPRHKGIQERFRVILPFKLSGENPYYFENEVDGNLLYSMLKARYPDADASCFSIGRKFFPFCGDAKRYEFHLNIPSGDDIWYKVSYEDLEAHKLVLEVKDGKKTKADKISRNDVVLLENKRTKVKISDISRSGTKVWCFKCDDIDSESASGQVNIDAHGNYNLYCHHEQKTYWEIDLKWNTEAEPDLYFDATVGHACLYDRVTGQFKYWKNDKDWASYTVQKGLPKEIFTKLPRCVKIADPKRDFGVFESGGELFYNSYLPGKYMEKYSVIQKRIKEGKQKKFDISGLPKNIPTIWKVMENVFGDWNDHFNIKLFLNWLAFLLQEREQSTLGWIIMAAPGSGKGLLAERVFRPIFGEHAVLIDDGDSMGARFNFEDVGCFLKFYNEVFSKAAFAENLKRREWLKHRIGTKEIMLESKGIDKQKISNFTNYVLLTNQPQAYLLEANDRRMNIVDTLKSSIRLTKMSWWPGKRKPFENWIAAEVPLLAHFLQNVQFDEDSANEATQTPARQVLVESSLEEVDYLIDKLGKGQKEYFDLDEIYPSEKATFGADSNADIQADIEEFIEKYHAIPSKYGAAVFGHHIRQASKVNIKRKLQQRGMIIGHQVWNPNTQKNVKVWIHEGDVGYKNPDIKLSISPDTTKLQEKNETIENPTKDRDLFA
jgi:hypothetical protein